MRFSLRSTVDVDAAQPRGDRGVGLAFHLPDRHRAQGLIPQAVEQSPALVGHQGGELGGRLRTQDQLEVQLGLLPGRPSPGAAPGLAGLAARQVDGLAHGEDEQELPEVVAPLELGELAAFGAAVEAVEGGQGDVLLVGGARGVPRRRSRARATRRWK